MKKNGKTVLLLSAGLKTDMNVPDGVEHTGDFAFWDCQNESYTS